MEKPEVVATAGRAADRAAAGRAGGRARLDIASYVRLTELADYIVPFAVRVVCDLGVADRLAAGPCRIEELAAATGAHAPSLERVLRALASRGVFVELADGRFDLTALAQPLRSDHPLSLRGAYPLLPAEIEAWARLDYSVRTGEPAFDLVHGAPYWDHYAADRDEGARVDALQAAATALHLRTLAPAYDWGGLGTVVDVGGGNGAFLAGLLARHPGLHGTLFDRPEVVAAAPEALARAGVADRCAVVGGDFFSDAIPAGADAYLLKTVLPGWDDDKAVALVTAVRAAMRPDSRLVALEAVPPPGNEFDVAKIFDVQTLVMAGGGHRDRAGLTDLFARAGLRLIGITPTASLSVVEAEPV